jgi:hypothetical protein
MSPRITLFLLGVLSILAGTAATAADERTALETARKLEQAGKQQEAFLAYLKIQPVQRGPGVRGHRRSKFGGAVAAGIGPGKRTLRGVDRLGFRRTHSGRGLPHLATLYVDARNDEKRQRGAGYRWSQMASQVQSH